VIYLTLPELLHVAGRVLGPEAAVRDYGLLEAALARPQATAFGKDAYPSLDAKAAALLHSLARNHALIDGNKRLALAAVIAFYGLNGRRLTLTNDQAYDLVMDVAAGELDQVEEIAAILQAATALRLPATGRSVRIPSQGAMLAGTISIPPGPGPHPGIVILQGSGPLDRHFESISQEIYLSLGFEVLAFDKRGVGASTGVFPGELATPASIGIQATDAAAAARFLMAQPGIDALPGNP
jgi:death on curing protein